MTDNPFAGDSLDRLNEQVREVMAELSIARQRLRRVSEAERPHAVEDATYWAATLAQVREARDAAVKARDERIEDDD